MNPSHRASGHRLLLALALLTFGCDDAEPADAGAPDAGPPMVFDAGAPDAGGPILDPATFDCTVASATPDRASARPLHCGLDPACTERLVSAHRGAGAPNSVFAPEDTLSAIRAAIVIGADMVELDVRQTSDGALVLLHDDTVDRTTSGTGEVAAMTLAEVQALEVDVGSLDGDFTCDRVPTMAEALAVAAGRVTLILEPKVDAIADVVQVLVDEGALDAAILDISPEQAEAAIAIDPGVRFFVRVEEPADVATLQTRFTANPPRYMHVGDSTDAALLAAVDDAGFRVFGLAFGADITADLRTSPQPYLDRWAQGVQMIQTNRPDRAVAALASE